MSYKSGKIRVPKILRNLFVSSTILIGLSACGGGSGGDVDNTPQPVNQPPSANAGTDQSVDEKTDVTLTGSGTDSDGTIASYSWVQTSGTSVVLQNTSSSTASFQAPEVAADEQLIFELTVTDDDGASATDSVQITILNVATVNQPPSANAGTDQSIDEKTNVTLTGSATDSDGTIASYSWVQTSGTSVTLQNADSSTTTFQAPDVTVDEQLIFELTVTDDDGASETDSVQITIIANQPPSANAGESQEALESTVVTLDGSASSDSDGTINSYNWEQISNGAPVLTISNATAANASIELPELANNVEFAFRLTVTDNDGDTAQDEVVITGRPTPSVVVGDVSGNSATLNSAAEFSVKLSTQPSFNVNIPVSSSDESEGVPEQSELTFTPENWQQAQTVVVRGTNENVQNGEQDYQIILGPATSSDSFYDGIDPNDVNLKGIELSISQPETMNQLIAGSKATLLPQITYTGNNQLSFSLTESPAGMSIDLSTGEIIWTPQELDEGQSFTVGVSVNDGNKFSTTSFQVTVAAPDPVTTEVEGNTLSVVDSSTTLKGMTITAQSTDLTQLNIEKLDASLLPEIPSRIKPVSDAFVVKTAFTESTVVEFPISETPDGYSIRDVNLYRLSTSDDVEGKFWSPVFVRFSYGGTVSNRTIKVELNDLVGTYFFGFQSTTETNQSQSNNVNTLFNQVRLASVRSIDVSTITCSPDEPLPEDNPGDEYRLQTCTDSNIPELIVTVKDFGTSANATKWGTVKIEELILWLIESQLNFDTLGLSYDDEFNVAFFDEAPQNGLITLGYVTSGDDRKTLFLNSNGVISSANAQTTAAHEYFHHAQSRSSVEGLELLIDQGSEKRWMIEGSARWFEDRIYDSLNSYRGTGNSRYLEKGLNSKDGGLEPYRRFSFIKMIESKCSGFDSSYINMINVDGTEDKSGLKSFNTELASANCNFGSHLGASKIASIEAALSYYSYATMLEEKMSLLDSNEEDNFNFVSPPHQFNQTWLNTISEWLNLTDDTVYKLNGVSRVPAVGAYSFKVPAISGELPEGKVAELVVESNREVIVSVTSESSDFIGTNTIGTDSHIWFSTVNQTSYIYDANGTAPELFVTLVNPSLDNSANVDVYFRIRDELDVDTIITSHVTGDQVSNRVVSIAGNIPEEARDSTSKVTITVNGIATDTTLNSDGSFVADVVVTLGDNVIKAQGFSGSTPVTNEEIITIQGVESSSTGRNALIASKVVFVLRWDTNSTDLDIYSTDKNGGTIWYSDKTEGPGNLDYDNTSGFGPEVVSYRATDDDVYVNGTFDIDVHYYSGSPSTNYTLDVVLNETEGGNRRSLKFDSVVPHTQSSSSQDGPSGSGASRFNDILTVSCSSQRICSLAGIDTSKLAQAGSATLQSIPVANAASVGVMAKSSRSTSVEPEESIGKDESAYTQCMAEFESSISKTGTIGWKCNRDGTKLWH